MNCRLLAFVGRLGQEELVVARSPSLTVPLLGS